MHTYIYRSDEKEGSDMNTRTVLLKLSVVKFIFISVPQWTKPGPVVHDFYYVYSAPPGPHYGHLIDGDESMPSSPRQVHCPQV